MSDDRTPPRRRAPSDDRTPPQRRGSPDDETTPQQRSPRGAEGGGPPPLQRAHRAPEREGRLAPRAINLGLPPPPPIDDEDDDVTPDQQRVPSGGSPPSVRRPRRAPEPERQLAPRSINFWDPADDRNSYQTPPDQRPPPDTGVEYPRHIGSPPVLAVARRARRAERPPPAIPINFPAPPPVDINEQIRAQEEKLERNKMYRIKRMVAKILADMTQEQVQFLPSMIATIIKDTVVPRVTENQKEVLTRMDSLLEQGRAHFFTTPLDTCKQELTKAGNAVKDHIERFYRSMWMSLETYSQQNRNMMKDVNQAIQDVDCDNAIKQIKNANKDNFKQEMCASLRFLHAKLERLKREQHHMQLTLEARERNFPLQQHKDIFVHIFDFAMHAFDNKLREFHAANSLALERVKMQLGDIIKDHVIDHSLQPLGMMDKLQGQYCANIASYIIRIKDLHIMTSKANGYEELPFEHIQQARKNCHNLVNIPIEIPLSENFSELQDDIDAAELRQIMKEASNHVKNQGFTSIDEALMTHLEQCLQVLDQRKAGFITNFFSPADDILRKAKECFESDINQYSRLASQFN